MISVTTIDHVNLRIPEDGLEQAVEFYRDTLGFHIDHIDLFEAGEKGFVSVRLTPTEIIHLQPHESFEPPAELNYDHVALAVENAVTELREALEAAGIEVEREIDALGATGSSPTIYIRDPFGYLLELTEAKPSGERL